MYPIKEVTHNFTSPRQTQLINNMKINGEGHEEHEVRWDDEENIQVINTYVNVLLKRISNPWNGFSRNEKNCSPYLRCRKLMLIDLWIGKKYPA